MSSVEKARDFLLSEGAGYCVWLAPNYRMCNMLADRLSDLLEIAGYHTARIRVLTFVVGDRKLELFSDYDRSRFVGYRGPMLWTPIENMDAELGYVERTD